MFTNWSLGRKIGVGFGASLVLMVAVAIWSLMGIGNIGNIGGNADVVITYHDQQLAGMREATRI